MDKMDKLFAGLSVREMEEIIINPVRISKDAAMERLVIRRLQRRARRALKKNRPA